jgi:ribulose-phosphate 3-epimerase
MAVKIAPSILSADFTRLGEQIRAAQDAGADLIHIDVMDGMFVPNITIGPLIVEAAKRATSLPLDVHLMIERPERYIEEFIKAGADYLVVHAEATVHLHRAVQQIRELGAKPGVALNPATPIEAIKHILGDLDMVVLMSVNPGFGGQGYIPSSTPKIRELRAMLDAIGSKALLEVDGGVKPSNAAEVIGAGADTLVMGSAFYGSKNYAEVVKKIREIAPNA